MRKVLFSALACVAFAGSGFAANEIVVENQHEIEVEGNHLYSDISLDELVSNGDPCQLTVRVYKKNRDGTLKLLEIGSYSSASVDCMDWATGIINEKKKEYPEAQVTYELTASPR